MAIKTIEILNVMVFKRHWRKNNGDLFQDNKRRRLL